MRPEMKYALLCIAFSITLNRFSLFQHPISDFLCGLFLAMGIMLFIVNMLPKAAYDKLLYRTWIAEKRGK